MVKWNWTEYKLKTSCHEYGLCYRYGVKQPQINHQSINQSTWVRPTLDNLQHVLPVRDELVDVHRVVQLPCASSGHHVVPVVVGVGLPQWLVLPMLPRLPPTHPLLFRLHPPISYPLAAPLPDASPVISIISWEEVAWVKNSHMGVNWGRGQFRSGIFKVLTVQVVGTSSVQDSVIPAGLR